MAKASGMSDDDLLGGDDDGEEVVGGVENSGADVLNEGQDEIIAGSEGHDNANDEDLEVVVLDQDEVEDKGRAADSAGGDDRGDASLDDDGGEEIDDRIGTDHLTDWEKKNYSKAMQGRVTRERRLKAAAEERATRESESAAAARKEAHEAKKMVADLLLVNIESTIKGKTAEVKAAKEAADTDAEMKAQGELDDLRAKKRDIEASKAHLEKSEPSEASAGGGQSAEQNPLTQRWLSRNRWMNDPRFADENAYARIIDARMAAEVKAGRFAHGPDTPQYFAELDRRIKEKMPTLHARAERAFGRSAQRPQSGRVAPVARGGASRSSAGGGKVTLDREDLNNMRNFGMDPKNKDHLKEYARNKIQRLRQEGATT